MEYPTELVAKAKYELQVFDHVAMDTGEELVAEVERLRSELETPANVGSMEGLGVNRAGSAILCYAWGETDRPCARVVHTLDEVKAFIVEQWLGSEDSVDGDNEPMLPGILAEIAEHDWRDDQSLTWDFEIGGVKLTDVFDA